MKYSNEQIMNLSTEELNLLKGKTVEVNLKNGKKYKGIVENLIESCPSHPPHLIGAIIIDKKKIELFQINILEVIF